MDKTCTADGTPPAQVPAVDHFSYAEPGRPAPQQSATKIRSSWRSIRVGSGWML